jgi:hypothetical protein
VTADGGISGVVAVQNDLGTTLGATRLGGIVSNGPLSGQVVVLGSEVADTVFHGGLKGGRIAVKGDVAGNMLIDGDMDPTSALVIGGNAGNKTNGTTLTINGDVKGIVGIEGTANFGKTPNTRHAVFFGTNIKGSADAAAIDAIFTDGGNPLSLDLSGAGLNLILTDLIALGVDAHGHLTGTKA